MITLILTRHGESDWNIQGKLAGSSDEAKLTENGKKQAIALSKKLKDFNIDIIYSSSLRRAKQTAQIIAKRIKRKVIYSSAFNERSWGTFEGGMWDRIQSNLMAEYESGNYDARPAGGESYGEFAKRILKRFERIIEKNQAKTILLVTHGGVIRALIPLLKKVPLEKSAEIKISNTSLTVFKMSEGKIIEELINDISHIGN